MNIIDKVAWIQIQNKKVLLARSRGNDTFYFPGGKREAGESDIQTLLREIKEEVSVDIMPETIKYLNTFKTQAHGRAEGVMLETKYYSGDFMGQLKPQAEIEELAWYDSKDMENLSEMGKLVFEWLKSQDLID